MPLLYFVTAATKTNPDLFTTLRALVLFGDFHLCQNLNDLFTNNDGIFRAWLWNSFFYARLSAVGSALVATLGGLRLRQVRFFRQALLYALVLGAVMVPQTALVIPLFLLLSKVGLLNTPWAVILPSLVFPIGVFLMRAYIDGGVSNDIIDAGRMDGAGEIYIFVFLVFRLVMPAFTTVLVLAFVASWNNYFLPLVVLNSSRALPGDRRACPVVRRGDRRQRRDDALHRGRCRRAGLDHTGDHRLPVHPALLARRALGRLGEVDGWTFQVALDFSHRTLDAVQKAPRGRGGTWNGSPDPAHARSKGYFGLTLSGLRRRRQRKRPDETPAVCRIGINIEDLDDLDMARDTFGAIPGFGASAPRQVPLRSTQSPSRRAPPASTSARSLPSGRVRRTVRVAPGAGHLPVQLGHGPLSVRPADRDHSHRRNGVWRRSADFRAGHGAAFLTPDIRDRLIEWQISDLSLAASVSEEASTYGMPGAHGARYARLEATVTLERTQLMTFIKLTSGVFAGVFIALLSFFYDPNDRGAFGGKLGLLVGVLFAVLVNLRSADSSIGDTGQLTLVTENPPGDAGAIVALAMVAMRD